MTPSSLNLHQPPKSENNDSESALSFLREDEDHLLTHSINPPLVEEQNTLTAKVQDFQKGVRTRIKQKYSRNHKVVIFYPSEGLNMILSVDQKSYKSSFVGAPTKLIFLHPVAAQIGISNKIAVRNRCKKI